MADLHPFMVNILPPGCFCLFVFDYFFHFFIGFGKSKGITPEQIIGSLKTHSNKDEVFAVFNMFL